MHGTEHMRGIIAMLCAVALFAIMDAQLKLLAGHYGPMQVSFLRGATSLPFVLLPIVVRGRLARLRPVNIPLHLLRGALSVVMLGSFVFAVRESSLATTYSIFMCAPLVVAALSAPLLGERVAKAQWGAICVGLAGVLLMLAPRGGGQWVSAGALAAVVAVATYSLAVVSLRMLARTDTTESMVFWFTMLLSIGAGLLAIPGWVTLHVEHWPLFVGIGVTGALGQHFITEAFRHAPAAVVTPFEYTALLWGVLLDLLVWRVLPGFATLCGGAIVVAAGLWLMARERRQGMLERNQRESTQP
jgi:drug/metabolite transporter (DMT)-like permease